MLVIALGQFSVKVFIDSPLGATRITCIVVTPRKSPVLSAVILTIFPQIALWLAAILF